MNENNYSQEEKHCIEEIDFEYCFKLLKKHLETSTSEKEKIELIEHTERVFEICYKIIEILEVKPHLIRYDEIKKAAIFHDIAKYKNKSKNSSHHKDAKSILEEHFKYSKPLDRICDIIRYHKGRFNPKTKIAFAAAILRMADKIDKINKGKYKKFHKSYHSNLKKIKKYLKNENIRGYDAFKFAVNRVKNVYLINKVMEELF